MLVLIHLSLQVAQDVHGIICYDKYPDNLTFNPCCFIADYHDELHRVTSPFLLSQPKVNRNDISIFTSIQTKQKAHKINKNLFTNSTT